MAQESRLAVRNICIFTRGEVKGAVTGMDVRLRPWSHYLVWTNIAYALAGVYALYLSQICTATLLLLCTIGSTLYHRFFETKWFNLDNIFALSLFGVNAAGLLPLMWSYATSDSAEEKVRLTALLVVSAIGIYCLEKAGAPALVTCSHGVYHRTENAQYGILHAVWHVLSAAVVGVGCYGVSVFLPGFDHGFDYGVGQEDPNLAMNLVAQIRPGIFVPLGSLTCLALGLVGNIFVFEMRD
jgi:hypothetical protein